MQAASGEHAGELSLEPECRRGHGAVYDAVSCGEIQFARLRCTLAAVALPAWPDGRIRLAVDVSNWLRPDAGTSPGRLFCHCYARGRGNAQMIPGWPYCHPGGCYDRDTERAMASPRPAREALARGAGRFKCAF